MSDPPETPTSASNPTIPQNSPPFPKNSAQSDTNPLSVQQLKAMDALLAGSNFTATAQLIGVDRKTLYHWRFSEPFRAEYERRQRLLWKGAIDRLRAMIPKAVATLKADMEYSDRSSRHRAAAAVLRLANMRSVVKVKDDE